ncbi:MAG: glycosyl transferase family 4, partial [archaeon]
MNEMIIEAGYLLILVASFCTAYVTFPPFIRRMHDRKIVGKDINKADQHEVAEMGGTVVLLGFVFAVMIGLHLNSYFGLFPGLDLLALLASLLTIVLVGILGIIDDVIGWKKGIRQYQHALFPIFAALPLMVLPQVIGNTGIQVPVFGFINFGIVYSLILVPIAVTGASNASNMLAGLNGLEGGMGLLNALAVL